MVKIVVWVINEDNGIGGLIWQEVLDEFDCLEVYYVFYDICFVLMGIYSINDFNFVSFVDGFDGNIVDDFIVAYLLLNDVIIINILFDYIFFWGIVYVIFNIYIIIYVGWFNILYLVYEMGYCLGFYYIYEIVFGVELVDGSNCGGVGDKFCDIFVDFSLGSNVDDVICIFIGIEIDGNGDNYSFDVINMMSYVLF